jgi:hypothetical protein
MRSVVVQYLPDGVGSWRRRFGHFRDRTTFGFGSVVIGGRVGTHSLVNTLVDDGYRTRSATVWLNRVLFMRCARTIRVLEPILELGGTLGPRAPSHCRTFHLVG